MREKELGIEEAGIVTLTEVETEAQKGPTGAGNVTAVLTVTGVMKGIGTETEIGKPSGALVETSCEGMKEGVNPGIQILQRYHNFHLCVPLLFHMFLYQPQIIK